MKEFDAVSLGILWDRLISITDEIVSSLIRTSFSINVRESYDLSCVLFDANGVPIAQGSYSVPSFTGTAAPTLRHMLRKYPPATLRPGDIVATNDPWMGTGHLYDINVMRPVFRKDKLVGYTLSITHLPDIGGVGVSAGPTQIYEEGLRLPVCKLMRAGVLDTELMELIRTNVRVNEQVIGDIMANISCNEVGGRLLLEFMDEYGLDDLVPLSTAILAQSERTMRERIRTIPDGIYKNRIDIEGVNEAIPLACTITKKDDSVVVDFAGTGDSVRAAINVPFCYTRAWAAYSIKCLTTPGTPNNEGSVRPINVTAPEGCILNTQVPFPTAGRHAVGHFIVPLMMGAMQDAVPDRVQADVGMMNIFNVQGTNRDGRGIASLFFLAGGFGALAGMDGAPTTPAPSNMGVVPTEMWENITSMTVERRELLPDSGGPGAARGGVGQEVVLVNDTGNLLTVAFMGQRTQFPAKGFQGGKAGRLRGYQINGKPVNPKGRFVLNPGDVISLFEAGGGGFGDPARRPPELVLADVRSGLVTAEGALRDYGVRVDLKRGTAVRA
ncbi:MAG: hydantoinase B/oxoprolinase family protein [Alphaproteobacteria bacterium]|nr:hydantoinase B/oxoprolinase family protein [Alphaproteobacteria bacterium]